ncbi:MAG: enoyl-CoA hydratase/isomerase family protein [Marmoricola sp.]
MSLVDLTVVDGVAQIGLNRPEDANAFDLNMTRELAAAVERAAGESGVRAVLLTGAGPRFCAGGDVASFATAPDQPAHIHQLATELVAAFRALADLDKPVVVAVRGAVAGAGLALMLSCDVIVSAPASKFVFAYPGIGFTPDCGLSYLLPRAIGQQRALGFALGGRDVDGTQALDWGLVTEVAEDAEARAREVAIEWASGPSTALGETRRLFRAGWELNRISAGAEEARTISRMVEGQEAQSLIARFVAR